MQLSVPRRNALVMTVALAATAQGAMAGAAEGPGGDPAAATAAPVQLEQVTVTARRTKENLQNTPVSVTALTAADISSRGLDNIIQVAQSTPNLTIMSGGNYSGKSAFTYIRGIGQDQFTFAFQPGVGYYIDGVYYGTVYGSIFELGDISSVQVLRGPQGTLFGRNNEGGAILLGTPEPKGDNSGEFEAGYGSYARVFIKGDVDVPLIEDKLALRVFGAMNSMDGYVTRIDYDCAHPGQSGTLPEETALPGCRSGTEGGDDERSLDSALKWTPTDDLESILRASLHIDQSEAGADTLLIQEPVEPGSSTANYDANVALPRYGMPISSPLYVSGSPFSNYASYTDPSTGYQVPPINHETFWSIADTTQWRAPDDVQVKNIVAYQKYRAEFASTDGTPIPTYLEDNILPYHQFTEEMDLSGNAFDSRLEWVAGVYYFESWGAYQGHVGLPTDEIVGPGILPFAPSGVYGANFNLNDGTWAKSRSAFLHGVYHLTRRLSLELGGRYSQDRLRQTYDQTYTATNPPNPLLPVGSPGFPPGTSGDTNDNRFDPKAAIQYQWTDNLMTYVSYATGYKAGGLNPKSLFVSDIKPFKQETVNAYEAGLKSEWLNRRLLANADVYLSDYRNYQLSEFLPPPLGDGSSIVINAGHATIKGVEADFKAVLLHGLSLEANGSFLDYKTLSLGGAANVVGNPTLTTRPPYVGRWQGSYGAEYDCDLGLHGMLTARADWSYRSKVFFDLANTEAGAQGGYGLLNLRLAWTAADGNWNAALEVDNATNKLYYTSKGVTLNADGSLFSVTGTPGMPITEFFTLGRKFQ